MLSGTDSGHGLQDQDGPQGAGCGDGHTEFGSVRDAAVWAGTSGLSAKIGGIPLGMDPVNVAMLRALTGQRHVVLQSVSTAWRRTRCTFRWS